MQIHLSSSMFTHVSYRLLAGFCCLGLVMQFHVSFAQESADEITGLTVAQYDKAKTFKINDLEKDTYVKFENAYVLDRYQMKPPYVFKYSDGIERKIYLYNLLDNKTKKAIGTVALYHSGGKTVNVCIPNATADKAVWAKYIDDLKEYSEKEKGMLSALSFTLSKEMSWLMASADGKAPAASSATTDYDVCFPADALVTLADGTEKKIADVQVGDQVAAYNPKTGKLENTQVEGVDIHQRKSYDVTTALLIREESPTASLKSNVTEMISLEATANHPVWTASGQKALKEIKPGETLYGLNVAINQFEKYKVYQIIPANRTVTSVYSLQTGSANYVVNRTVVLEK